MSYEQFRHHVQRGEHKPLVWASQTWTIQHSLARGKLRDISTWSHPCHTQGALPMDRGVTCGPGEESDHVVNKQWLKRDEKTPPPHAYHCRIGVRTWEDEQKYILELKYSCKKLPNASQVSSESAKRKVAFSKAIPLLIAKTYLPYKSSAVRSEGHEDPQIGTESFANHFLLVDLLVLKLPAQPETKRASLGRNQGLDFTHTLSNSQHLRWLSIHPEAPSNQGQGEADMPHCSKGKGSFRAQRKADFPPVTPSFSVCLILQTRAALTNLKWTWESSPTPVS